MKCKNCGYELSSDDAFCPNCGTKADNDTIVCDVCGASIEKDSDFCPYCGSNLKDIIKCPTCGHVNSKGDKFCLNCGEALSKKNNKSSKKEVKEKKIEVKEVEEIKEVEETKEVEVREETIEPEIEDTQIQYDETDDIPVKKSKAPLIIVICLAAAVLIAVGLMFFLGVFDNLFGNSSNNNYSPTIADTNKTNVPNPDNNTEKEDKHDTAENKETETVVEETKQYTYYDLTFVDNVRVREHPSTDADQVGKIAKGSTLIGYSTRENEGYTWYQIGYNEWVANDGTFLNVDKIKSKTEYTIEDGSSRKVNVTKDVSIFDGPGSNYNAIGWLVSTSKFNVFESVKDDSGNTWLKISPCAYILKSCTEYVD